MKKTITIVKTHYIGKKTISEAFSTIIKNQIENNIYNKVLIDDENCDKINVSNLLSESEDLCKDNRL